jgi:hypothetical protein
MRAREVTRAVVKIRYEQEKPEVDVTAFKESRARKYKEKRACHMTITWSEIQSKWIQDYQQGYSRES